MIGYLGAIGLALAGGATAAGPSREQPALPGWMEGCWIEERGADWAEECWTGPRGGMMMGSGRIGTGDRVTSWEAMQIVRDPAGALAFQSSPEGQGRTVFRWQGGATQSVTFVNAGHDYPQRVQYWREGEILLAEIALADGSRAKRWRFRRN